MDIDPTQTLIYSLKKGELPDVQPWDLSAAVREIADSLGRKDDSTKASEIRAACRILNKYQYFEQTAVLGQSWVQSLGFDAVIARHHAQALINLSALDSAEQLLKKGLAVIQTVGADIQAKSEITEYEGLLGRIMKQRFVNTGDHESLLNAITQYQRQYDGPAKPYWHGINLVALRARGEREGLRRDDSPAVSALASAVFRRVLSSYKKDASDPWLASTLSEASLALGKCEQAELWLYRFLHHLKVQPFDIDSYDRQLREIWGGSVLGGGNVCADRLTTIISNHLMRSQKRWSISSHAVQSTIAQISDDPLSLEKNFSGEYSFGLGTIKSMLAACASIGCVTNTRGERLGTGFLVRGSFLKHEFGEKVLFITNAHVISDTVPNAIPPKEALVTFEVESTAAGSPVFYQADEIIFTSPPGKLGLCCPGYEQLDVTIVTLKGLTESFVGLKAATSLPLIDSKTKAYVVGHPRGSGLQFSLHDSMFLDFDDEERLVHYRTPTEPGSSGSPVFNSEWQVIAVHHGGSPSTPRLHGQGYYEANEGIALSAVRHKLNS